MIIMSDYRIERVEAGDASHHFGMMQRPSGIVCSLVAPVQFPRVEPPRAGHTAWVQGAHVGCHWRAFKVQEAGPQFGLSGGANRTAVGVKRPEPPECIRARRRIDWSGLRGPLGSGRYVPLQVSVS